MLARKKRKTLPMIRSQNPRRHQIPFPSSSCPSKIASASASMAGVTSQRTHATHSGLGPLFMYAIVLYGVAYANLNTDNRSGSSNRHYSNTAFSVRRNTAPHRRLRQVSREPTRFVLSLYIHSIRLDIQLLSLPDTLASL